MATPNDPVARDVTMLSTSAVTQMKWLANLSRQAWWAKAHASHDFPVPKTFGGASYIGKVARETENCWPRLNPQGGSFTENTPKTISPMIRGCTTQERIDLLIESDQI